VVKIEVISVVTSHSVMVGDQHFRGTCCLYLQGEDGGNMVFRPAKHTSY